MGLDKCPRKLRNFAAAFYKLVIPQTGTLVHGLLISKEDPRLTGFKTYRWVDAFKSAMDEYGASNIHTPHLDKLIIYVDTTPGCDNVFPVVDVSSISREQGVGGSMERAQSSISNVARYKRKVVENIFYIEDKRQIPKKASHANPQYLLSISLSLSFFFLRKNAVVSVVTNIEGASYACF
ncbi:hypothetical protein COEREDRAFT_87834 [Coemansia reversa NRRL 1564]|uniref:Uncharacterized protein n=1 Tax=Coemansia reversa (strain ATCC 12441 / NRRL 1564) TaxID=763665 RepID=A0A2G5B8S3_COERN|nr:hypothetical protein COEREDRAFT_87834 [Coemansia reversa NRRL 1564]|eukprot:PIA15418.1 hypothetical protein COEREDRAFT_87834 [Coemansia reversa NRRL 1564]